MRCYVGFLACCALLAFAGCTKSAQITTNTTSVSATPETNIAASSPGNQSSQSVSTNRNVASNGQIDACALLTSRDIQSVQGEALKETTPSGRSEGGFAISQCFYTLPTSINSISLLVAQKGDSTGARDPKEFWKDTFHRADESDRDRDKDRDKDKAHGREQEEEQAAPLQKIDGLGDDAYWTGNRVGGAIYALKGNTYIRISVGGPGDQATKIKKSKALAQMILKRL